jgi:hypothetical protein
MVKNVNVFQVEIGFTKNLILRRLTCEDLIEHIVVLVIGAHLDAFGPCDDRDPKH